MTTCYICCACNRTPHSVDYGTNGLICYGACNAVAIYDPNESVTGKVLETLHGHSDRVNIVRWIQTKDAAHESEFLSASADGTAIIWTLTAGAFKPTSTLNADNVITIANSLYNSESVSSQTRSCLRLLVCIGSINGDVKLWERNEDGKIDCFQTLTFKGKLPIEACLSFLPNGKITVLAIAMEDSTIQLFSQNSMGNDLKDFVKIQVLSGHKDWVRCMDFTYDDNEDVLLASGSQDSTIRLWKIAVDRKEVAKNELKQKVQQFIVDDNKYNITLESILSGHEGWIYGINWCPAEIIDGKYHRPMKLLSSSLDKTMIIWEPDVTSGVWLESVRVGEVGGNSLGFYGCKFGPDGQSILAHGYQGSFHIWNYSPCTKNWIPGTAPSGHFAEVTNLCWDPKGRFLITASSDQTTRIHAPWNEKLSEAWHEIGRPQVHGYDMNCLAMLSSYVFVSGAEENVIRIFTAPATFVNYLRHVANVNDFQGTLPESASVPALGLTNKAIYDEENTIEKNSRVDHSKDIDYERPPTEEELIQHTLWPELQKLYGHGYEIFSIAARHDGSLLATACKSSSIEYSAIILWNTKTWSQIQKLTSHQLTVTQMAFSPNDEYLLSVSRDRRWSLFRCNNDTYNLIAASLKKDSLHSRIIWCCAWTHDSKYFATGSRDGKIGIWSTLVEKSSKDILPITNLETKVSVTALSFTPLNVMQDSYVLAVGFESGCIEIQKIILKENDVVWKKYVTYDTSYAHHLSVKRLMFQPQCETSKTTVLRLASCGCDHIVKIFNLRIKELLYL